MELMRIVARKYVSDEKLVNKIVNELERELCVNGFDVVLRTDVESLVECRAR